MEYVTLPNTDLVVSRLAFGCEPLGGTDWGEVDVKAGMAAVAAAVDRGVTLFDTADVYGLGLSEARLSEALGTRRHDVVIATKFGVAWEPSTGRRSSTYVDCSPERVVAALEHSLRRLALDCIPLYFIHRPDPAVPLERTIAALQRCQERGKVRYIGLSNFDVGLVEQAVSLTTIAAIQIPYNVAQRDADRTLLPYCEQHGLGALAYGPLAQGLLTGKYDRTSRFSKADRRHRLRHFAGTELDAHLQLCERLKRVACRHGRSVAQVAVRWLLDRRAVFCAIVGMKSCAQLEENLGSVGWGLDQRDLLEIDGSDSQGSAR